MNSKLYQEYVASSLDGIYLLSVQGKFMYANPAYCSLVGKSQEQLLEMDIWELESLYYPSRDAWQEQLKFIRTRSVIVYQTTYLTASDRKEIPVQVSITLLRSDKGESAISATVKTITQQKGLEERLNLIQWELNAVIENTQDAIWAVDTDFRLLLFNRTFYQNMKDYFGIEAKEGMVLSEHLPQSYAKQWRGYYQRCMAGESFKEEIYTPGHAHTHVIAAFNPITGEDGCVKGCVVLGHNITHVKKYEQKLEQQNQELLKINREMDRFLYSTSHDLKAPLASVLGLINLIRLTASPTEKELCLSKIEVSINRLINLIGHLMNFSYNNSSELFIEKIDLHEEVLTTIQEYDHLDPENKILKKVEISGERHFYTDKARVRVIIENLVSNSLKFRTTYVTEPYLKVSIKVNYRFATITIEDNGNGIREEHLDKVFNMFFKGDDQFKGAGLGLYIVKETTAKIGGTLSMRSEFGKGSSFTIKLPNMH